MSRWLVWWTVVVSVRLAPRPPFVLLATVVIGILAHPREGGAVLFSDINLMEDGLVPGMSQINARWGDFPVGPLAQAGVKNLGRDLRMGRIRRIADSPRQHDARHRCADRQPAAEPPDPCRRAAPHWPDGTEVQVCLNRLSCIDAGFDGTAVEYMDVVDQMNPRGAP